MNINMKRFNKVCHKFKYKYNLRLSNQQLEPLSEKINVIQENQTPKSPQNDLEHLSPLLSKSHGSSQQCTPTRQYFDENESLKSPKSNSRVPRFHLNLDLPEHDDDSLLSDKESSELERTISVDSILSDEDDNRSNKEVMEEDGKRHSINLRNNSYLIHVSQKELASSNSYLEIPSTTFDKANCLPPESFWIKENDQCKVDLEIGEESNEKIYRKDMCCIQIDDNMPKTELNPTYNSSFIQEMSTPVQLPAISNLQCSDDKIMTEFQAVSIPEMQIVPSSKNNNKNLKIETFIKIPKFCNWLLESFVSWFKNGYEGIKKLMMLAFATCEVSTALERELSQVVAVIKCENDRVLTVISEKVSILSEEFVQIRDNSESKFISLKNDMKELQAANEKLMKINKNLSAELKNLQETVNEIKSASVKIVTPTFSSKIPLSSPNFKATIAPPPPPIFPNLIGASIPPPPPLPSTPLYSITKMKDIDTPKVDKDNNNKEAYKKKTPFADRPPITVDDLLKVTLKKAPQSDKDGRRNILPGPRGPVISLDMLRNVKLRSSRRKSLDQHKSPRTASRVVKNRSQSNLTSVSPMSRGSPESSLLRLLRPVDLNKRVFQRIQSLPNSGKEVDLNKRDTSSPKLKLDNISDSVFI